MPASDRTVYGRPFKVTPLWIWLVQRASGVLLGPLVLLHMSSTQLAANRVLNAILLAVVLAHGYSGLRRIALKRDRFGFTLALNVLWCGIVAFFSVLLVLYHSPQVP